jgi:hypothetical protein
MKLKKSALALMLTGTGFLGLAGYSSASMALFSSSNVCKNKQGEIIDEAMCAGRTAASLKGADEDYFRDMDYGITKRPEELAKTLAPFVPGITPEEAVRRVAIGRNNWNVWTAGNDRLWDTISYRSVGNLDFLKTLSNHPNLKFSRDNRWSYLGLVNEPCFEKGTGPRKDRYGLWLDVRSKDCPPDPFENEEKYPGVKIGARGKNIPAGSYYGYATGIVGLRLFPNPDFDEKAEKAWDPERYYTDPSYYNNKNLVRPYRVGMACGFCHVGPNPTNPPADPEHPKWENLNSNPGAQYFWIDRIFSWEADPSAFPFQLFATSRPGALDTSLISSDYINNPRTMNAVYNLVPRLLNAKRFGEEKLGGGSENNKQLNDYVKSGPLTEFYKAPDTVFTPRVLKDGADSVGALGALNRVFINIGLFSEDWLTHFNPLIGGKPITPIKITQSRKNSVYWQANEAQTPDLALFFVAGTRPDLLKNAPGGEQKITKDAAVLARGKEVFAERCARCHSSKLPEKAYSFFPNNGGVGPNYLNYWNNYWRWTQTDEFKKAMVEIVKKDDFLQDNFLSTELRIPVTLLETNACSPLATNAIEGNIWNDFSSKSYKSLPSVGKFTVHHPITGKPWEFDMPGGGLGYTRPASLVSVWSTAPFFLNNALGKFEESPSVEARLSSFDDSIHQLLWPETRKGNIQYQTANGKMLPGWIDRTFATSYLRVPAGFLPDWLNKVIGKIDGGKFAGEQGLELGPIPKGTPVNLLTNINLDRPEGLVNRVKRDAELIGLLLKIKRDLKALPKNATDEQAAEVFKNLVDPLVKNSKCPDYIVNRGHYFGTEYFKEADIEPGLSDEDKNALIEFVKTF